MVTPKHGGGGRRNPINRGGGVAVLPPDLGEHLLPPLVQHVSVGRGGDPSYAGEGLGHVHLELLQDGLVLSICCYLVVQIY